MRDRKIAAAAGGVLWLVAGDLSQQRPGQANTVIITRFSIFFVTKTTKMKIIAALLLTLFAVVSG
jgi:hypothetical protein